MKYLVLSAFLAVVSSQPLLFNRENTDWAGTEPAGNVENDGEQQETAALPVSLTYVVCPSGQYQCQDGQTCCRTESGQWGCCPYPRVSVQSESKAWPYPQVIVQSESKAWPYPQVSVQSESKAWPCPRVSVQSESKAWPYPQVSVQSESKAWPYPQVSVQSESKTWPCGLYYGMFHVLKSSRAVCPRVSAFRLALWSHRLGKRELVCVLLVHSFVFTC